MFFPKNILAKIGFNLHHPSRNLLRKTSIYTTPSFHTAGAYSLLVNLPPGLASWHREVVGRLAATIGITPFQQFAVPNLLPMNSMIIDLAVLMVIGQ